ncbi:MAG: NAD(P)H-hydrate dehydratase, partial [Ilumatobacteraceae bacterium]
MPPLPRAEQPLDVDVLRSWPLPADDQHDKRRRGTVLVIGGSDRTPGAVLLAGIAALRSGAGRLQIATAPEVAAAVAVAVPEALVTSIDDDRRPTLADLVAAADSVVVGPGLTDREQTDRLVALVLE